MTFYSIKSIPTTYAGVNFRSRLEARWAAFFDLCGWKWDFEPFDLDGWAPDFKLTIGEVVCLVEVKPVDSSCEDVETYAKIYDKACAHAHNHNILLLCDGPVSDLAGVPLCEESDLDKFADAIRSTESDGLWREAGNIVQWIPEVDDYASQMRRIFRKAA